MHASKLLTLLLFSLSFDLMGAQKESILPLQIINAVDSQVYLSFLYGAGADVRLKQHFLKTFERGDIQKLDLAVRTSLSVEILNSVSSEIISYEIGNLDSGWVYCYGSARSSSNYCQSALAESQRVFSMPLHHRLKIIIADDGLKLEPISS